MIATVAPRSFWHRDRIFWNAGELTREDGEEEGGRSEKRSSADTSACRSGSVDGRGAQNTQLSKGVGGRGWPASASASARVGGRGGSSMSIWFCCKVSAMRNVRFSTPYRGVKSRKLGPRLGGRRRRAVQPDAGLFQRSPCRFQRQLGEGVLASKSERCRLKAPFRGCDQ